MKILIAPYAAKLRNGSTSAKQYPHWPELVSMLRANGHEILQIGVQGEQRIEGVDQFIVGWPFEKIRQLMDDCVAFVSVDSWFPHFAHYHRLKNGVVLWGKSSPRIFGYPDNENLFVSESNFRSHQYKDWENEPYDESVFVPPRQVVWAVERLIQRVNHASTQSLRPEIGAGIISDRVQLAESQTLEVTT
jgi:ADP-heptose:LPS heptosyltransferase